MLPASSCFSINKGGLSEKSMIWKFFLDLQFEVKDMRGHLHWFVEALVI